MLRPGDFFRTEEASISDLNRQIETLETAGRYRELLRTIEETETEVAREIAAAKARMRIAKTAREARRREHPDENTQTALVRESQYEKAELHRLKQSWKIGSHRFTRNEPPSRNESNPCAASVRPVLRLFRQNYFASSVCSTPSERYAIWRKYSHRLRRVHPRPVQGSVRPPNCCNKLICTDGNLLPWPSSGGVIPPRQRYAITATIIRLAKESANLYCNTCCKVYK